MTRSQPSPATLVAAAAQALREHGLPVTVQRRRLLEGFVTRTDHPSAEALFLAIEPTLPGLSRTTVYRTLEKLVELGLAARIGHPGAGMRYDPRVERHHHLVCDVCGAVADHESPVLDTLRLPRGPAGFEVRDYTVLFRGRCASCARPHSKRGSHES